MVEFVRECQVVRTHDALGRIRDPEAEHMVPNPVEVAARAALFLSDQEVPIQCKQVATINGHKLFECEGVGVWPPDVVTIAEYGGIAECINQSFEAAQAFLRRSQPTLEVQTFVPFFDRYLCPRGIGVMFEPRLSERHEPCPGWHAPKLDQGFLVLYCYDANKREYFKLELSPDYAIRQSPV